jgi:hypothetical protein
MWVITLVRWYGRSEPGATRREVIACSISRTELSVPVSIQMSWRRQERPSLCSRSSAECGPQVPAA